MAERTKVFIAYCFPEKRWMDRVHAAIEPFAGEGRCVIWDERKLKSGVAWKTELPEVLATTKVAMMIVSDLFLESDFVTRAKLPALLERERESGLEICWVLAGQCLFELAGLKEADLGNRVGSAFDGLGLAQRDAEVAVIAKKVAGYLGVEARVAPAEPVAKKPLLPSAIPQVLTPKVVPKKKRKFGATKGSAEKSPQPALLPAEPAPAVAPEPAQPPKPLEPAPVPKLVEVPPPAPPPQDIPALVAPPEPAPVEPVAPQSARELSLETMIQARQVSVLTLSQLARVLVFVAAAIALASLVVIFVKGFLHFLLVGGFALFVAGLALWLHARSRFLGQGLVAMRYTSSGLADAALPTRQREALVRKADEYLAQH